MSYEVHRSIIKWAHFTAWLLTCYRRRTPQRKYVEAVSSELQILDAMLTVFGKAFSSRVRGEEVEYAALVEAHMNCALALRDARNGIAVLKMPDDLKVRDFAEAVRAYLNWMEDAQRAMLNWTKLFEFDSPSSPDLWQALSVEAENYQLEMQMWMDDLNARGAELTGKAN